MTHKNRTSFMHVPLWQFDIFLVNWKCFLKYLLPALLIRMSTFEVILPTSSANFRTDDKLAKSNSISKFITYFHESTIFFHEIFFLLF